MPFNQFTPCMTLEMEMDNQNWVWPGRIQYAKRALSLPYNFAIESDQLTYTAPTARALVTLGDSLL